MSSAKTLHSSSPSPSWFRGFIQGKTRIALAWLFAALLVLSARQFPQWPGIALCFVGATLRFWASGYLRKDSRPAIGGPYAHVRNPLYLGTYLMALGTALSIQAWALLAGITVLYAWIYHFIILDEEIKLERLFGTPYLEYKKLVPRFFPRLLPASRAALIQGVNPDPEAPRFSWEIAKKNKAFEAYWSFLGLLGFVALLAWAWTTFGN